MILEITSIPDYDQNNEILNDYNLAKQLNLFISPLFIKELKDKTEELKNEKRKYIEMKNNLKNKKLIIEKLKKRIEREKKVKDILYKIIELGNMGLLLDQKLLNEVIEILENLENKEPLFIKNYLDKLSKI